MIAAVETEEWRVVPGFPLYQASNLGRVRRHPDHPSHLMRDELRPTPNKSGYPRVAFMRGGRPVYIGVHQAVCAAFHGPKPSPRHEVAHNDSNPANARADNLRWATRAENHADKRQAGTHREGERIPWSKLTEREVKAIRSMLADGVKQSVLARAFGVNTGTIHHIMIRRTWAHVA